jgi:DNA-binding response OmpR family regulator
MKNNKILVVEDDLDLRDLICSVIKTSTNFEVLCAENGKNALEIVRTEPVSVIITDVQMPIMNGMEFLKQVRTFLGEQVPVFIMTGFSLYTEQKFLDEGASGYFEKPLDLDKLVLTLKKAV